MLMVCHHLNPQVPEALERTVLCCLLYAGFERWLTLLQGVPTVFDTDLLRPLVADIERLSGKAYGSGGTVDYYLRSVADHARSVAFLVSDGVTPSNEDRGYVVRSVIRRAVRRGYQLGIERPFLPTLVQTVVTTMGDAYPDLARNADTLLATVQREEERFRQTLASGSALLEDELQGGAVSGEVAFKLHDTYGFPIELTEEIAAERGVAVDRAGFDAAMSAQRARARQARKGVAVTSGEDGFGIEGPTEFVGYATTEATGRVLAVAPGGENGTVEIYLDRTPFYAEGGGQVGDTGTITTATGTARVLDTTAAPGGLIRHVAQVVEGEVDVGQDATATVDPERRDAIRRNHTGTHLLHWALREVLGSHVKQQGSLVAPDYLRFDFSHHASVAPDDLDKIETMVNERILANEPVRAYETTKDHAEQLGAIAFFGDKYGDFVRVVEAGERSMELCGGTHVGALGTIGPVKIVSEGSIGSNMRRIFAVTGTASLERIRDEERTLERAAALLRAAPDEVPAAIERVLLRQRALDDELKALRSQSRAPAPSRWRRERRTGS